MSLACRAGGACTCPRNSEPSVSLRHLGFIALIPKRKKKNRSTESCFSTTLLSLELMIEKWRVTNPHDRGLVAQFVVQAGGLSSPPHRTAGPQPPTPRPLKPLAWTDPACDPRLLPTLPGKGMGQLEQPVTKTESRCQQPGLRAGSREPFNGDGVAV